MSIQASTAALRQICQRLFLPPRRGPRHPASGRIRLDVATRVITLVAFGFLVLFPNSEQCLAATVQPQDKGLNFQQLLQKIAEISPDPCGPPYKQEEDWHTADIEYRLFARARDSVTQALNATPDNPESPLERATEALRNLEQVSAVTNADWPEEHRFHFQVLDLTETLVVKMTIRTDGRYFVFGKPEERISEEAKQLWQPVGSDEKFLGNYPPTFSLELFPLHRGPSGNARFLAKLEYAGCAGSIGVTYEGREWDPDGLGHLDEIINQSGSFGLSDDVPDFPLIGKLQTEGTQITLPYCWFSAIDTWDNPSLCAVDIYDLSGDNVQFHSREYNRPDLVPIAKVIEYAQKHDYDAVLAYSASSQVALSLVRDLEPHFFAEDVQVTATENGEHVEMGEGFCSFDVEEIAGRWVVVAFNVENDQ